MNSEELELSLRTEFENYLKGVLAGMRQDVAEYQRNFEAEFEKHKTQMDEAFRNLEARFDSDIKFDQAFTESVVEHLRLARDDGAQLSAQAFSEAQKLSEESASKYDRLRDAINEISGQTTQSSILKSLIDHASHFASRGAFFIVKNDNLVCWRKFDLNGHWDDEAVRDVSFPLAADSLLSDAVRSLSTRDTNGATTPADFSYLDALGFGRPDRMFAIPLTARGRGVAVLYADSDEGSDPVNLEALESLVRVAALTVELRATASTSPHAEAPSRVPMQPVDETNVAEVEPEHVAEAEQYEEYTGGVAVEEASDTFEAEVHEVTEEVETVEPSGYDVESSDGTPAPAEPVNDFAFASNEDYDASASDAEVEAEAEPTEEYSYSSEPEPDAAPTAEYSYAGETAPAVNGHTYDAVQEPVVEVAGAQPVKSRLSDRHVDLPIEVADEERRFHNDARRFARLLVSEIKLYNEQKVSEGRDASDLYDRLREAIDRSREMYDKRVQPQVAAKFDYFHYELVNNLAEGNGAKLGSNYPGAAV